MTSTTPNTLYEIRDLFEQFGQEPYYGEEVQLAAFLHDIGHMLPAQDQSELIEGYGRRDEAAKMQNYPTPDPNYYFGLIGKYLHA